MERVRGVAVDLALRALNIVRCMCCVFVESGVEVGGVPMLSPG